MLLNDADRITDSKKMEDAYSAQRRNNKKEISQKSEMTREMN